MKKVFEKDKLLPEIAGLVQEGYAVTIPVRGNSMLPFLRDGRDAVSELCSTASYGGRATGCGCKAMAMPDRWK